VELEAGRQNGKLRQGRIAAVLAACLLMLETNDEWTVARRYMSLETLARVNDNPNIRLPAVAT
jgi:hypothetical protein